MFSGKFALSGHNSLDQAIAHAFLQGYSAGCRNSGWSVYRTVSGLHVNVSTNQHEVDCDTDVLRILLRPYIKLAASLILLWALSKQGRQQEHQSQIVLKATHLILSDLDQKSLDRGA
jgi:hypothetical protein